MKKSFNLLSTAIFGVMLIVGSLTSCDRTKEKEATDLQATVSPLNAEQEVVSEENFDSTLETYILLLNGTNHLSVKAVPGGYTFEVLEGLGYDPEKKAACTWGGSVLTINTFVKCVYGIVQVHHCAVVRENGGVYTADPC